MSLYRRLLRRLQEKGAQNIYSHQIAELAGVTAAQVRRDWMAIGYKGSSSSGYNVQGLIESIGGFLDSPLGQNAALIGTGHLGRAILAYFVGRNPKLNIAAAFDNDPEKIGTMIQNLKIEDIARLKQTIEQKKITIGIIAVTADAAQEVADRLVDAGVKGVMNFAPVILQMPKEVFVENIDLAVALEKVAYFADHINNF